MSAGEFEIIARHFAPLATAAGARGLKDDAALFEGRVITADAIVEGVHFLPDDPIDTVAQKALRVNLSDLAAKGAAPIAYLMTLQWPDARDAREIAAFAQGLARDQAAFGLALLGGDTTCTPGPLTVSVTMIGRPFAAAPSRAGARVGDDVWVSGTIGDGVLGLAAARGSLALDAAHVAHLVERYRRPSPRVGLAPAIALRATASMDVSDGLLGDAAKIAAASGVRLVLDLEAMPLSGAAAAWLAAEPDNAAARAHLAVGGDDYELLFTAPPHARAALMEAADDLGLPLTRIGRVGAGDGVEAGGAAVAGHVHRLGA